MVKDICLLHQLLPLFYTLPNVRKSKTLFDSGFHAVDSRFQIPGAKLQILCQWILDFSHYWDSQFVKKYFGLQKPGIPDSGFSDSKAKTSWILVFRFPNVG